MSEFYFLSICYSKLYGKYCVPPNEIISSFDEKRCVPVVCSCSWGGRSKNSLLKDYFVELLTMSTCAKYSAKIILRTFR